MDWPERILLFPVRTAAVDAFLRELKARRAGDLNGVLTTFNDGGLCREALKHWLANEWIVIAPADPLVALAGPRLTHDLTLRSFCGQTTEPQPETPERPQEMEGIPEPANNEREDARR